MTLPEPLPRMTAAFLADLDTSLGADLVGVYAYGSATAGGFEALASDLDLCIVTARSTDEIDPGLLHGLVDRLAAREPEWANRLDLVFVGQSTLAEFRAGGPLVSISHDEPLQRYDDADGWLQTWYLVRTADTALTGPPANQLIPPIPASQFTDAVTRHTLDLAHRSSTADRSGPLAYVGLTLCRVLCLIDTGREVSKRTGAAWLVERERWASHALDACLRVSASHGREPFAPAEEVALRRLISNLAGAVERRRHAS